MAEPARNVFNSAVPQRRSNQLGEQDTRSKVGGD